MQENLVRLRKTAAECGDRGSAEARDTSIRAFLEELESVVCKQIVDLMPDQQLRNLYVSWTNQLLLGLDTLSRRTWLVEGISITPSAAGRHIQPAPPENVVSLHARH